MNKWTWLTLVAFVAVLGGSYYLLSQPKGKGGKGDEQGLPKADGGDMDVEDFDAPDDGEGNKDTAYDMLDDPDAAQGTPSHDGTSHGAVARSHSTGTDGVETIDEGDDPGETVDGPVVLEDNDETIEPARTGQ